MRKYLLLSIIPLIILVLLGWSLANRNRQTAAENSEKKVLIEPVNQIPISERPFSLIIPRSDGKEVTLVMNQLDNHNQLEYELEYQAGTKLELASGTIDFAEEETPVKRNVLLGTCSAGGKCSYHDNVKGGTLTLRYLDGETVKLRSEWNFQQMQDVQGTFTSRDAKFSLVVGKTGLPGNTFVIVTQTMGLPGELAGELVGGPYAVVLPDNVKVKNSNMELQMRLASEASNVQLFAWVNQDWQAYPSEISGKILSATVEQPTTFVVVALNE